MGVEDKEESLLRGYLPLPNDTLRSIEKGEKVEAISYPGNGYLTDAVFHLMRRSGKAQDALSQLKKIDLIGCNQLTDHGIHSLLSCIGNGEKLDEIELGGCERLTDSTAALFLEMQKKCKYIKFNLNGTSVAYLHNHVAKKFLLGCPNLHIVGTMKDVLEGQILIAPVPSFKKSLGDYLETGQCTDRRADRQTHVKTGDWNLTLTEVSTDSCLFDSLSSTSLTQVVIPFDASSDPKDIKDHVLSTISRLVAKEKVWCDFPKEIASTGGDAVLSSKPFLEMFMCSKHHLREEGDGTFKMTNASTSETAIGAWGSRIPMSRSNNYIEVTVRAVDPVVEKSKAAFLFGVMYDKLYLNRAPMDSTIDDGGYVDGFEIKESMTLGFGIEGAWESEYVPSATAKYYFMEDGVKKAGKVESKYDKPQCGMYPVISILGEIECEVTLPPFVQAPKEILSKWQKENRWIEKGWTFNCLVDGYGRLTYANNYTNSEKAAYFLGISEVTKKRDTVSVKAESLAVYNKDKKEQSCIKIGLASEEFNDSTKCNSVVLTVHLLPWFPTWPCPNCNNENKGKSALCDNCPKGKRPSSLLLKKLATDEWTCDKCQFPNESHVDKCTSCKDGTKPEGFGVPIQTVECVINKKATSKTPVEMDVLKEGDVLTVKVLEISNDSVHTVVFLHNGKEIHEVKFPFSKVNNCLLVPYISVGGTDKLILENYRPSYRRPAPYMDKVTVGRAHHVTCLQTGEIAFIDERLQHGKKEKIYGTFIGKTPFNREQLEFEVTATELDYDTRKGLLGLGVCHADYPCNGVFVGWHPGSVGYHADNGQFYDNSSVGVKPKMNVDKDSKILQGDKVCVKIQPVDDKTPLKFNSEGVLDSNQTVLLCFTKNGVVHFEQKHTICSEALYPCLSLSKATVRIHNYYEESNELYEEIERKKMVDKQLEAENQSLEKKVSKVSLDGYHGTEYLVVGVKSGSSDPEGKLQILQQQLDLTHWPQHTQVTDAIVQLEKNVSELDWQDQQMYSSLCAVEANMRHLKDYPGRIKYQTLDMDTPEEKSSILEKFENTFNQARQSQSSLYQFPEKVIEWGEAICEGVKRSKIIELSEIFQQVPELKGADGAKVKALLKDLHSKGKIVLFDLGLETVVADMTYMLEIGERLKSMVPSELLQDSMMVTCIGSSSHVWHTNGLLDKLIHDLPEHKSTADGVSPGSDELIDKLKVVKNKMDVFGPILERVFAMICVPLVRSQPEDAHFIYMAQNNISNTPVPISDYWGVKKDRSLYVVMSQTYQFPLGCPHYILSLIISSTSKYGRFIILNGNGVVFQNGAVQTVIVKHKEAGENVITIESYCYMPDGDGDDAKMAKQASSYVQDYTWNIFCIFTDIIDDLLKRSNIVTMVTRDVPYGMVNVSIGCKHQWMSTSGKVRQSVCTMCNCCCDRGDNCSYNGIMGCHIRECGCQTEVTGCKTCGICRSCAHTLWSLRSRLRPFALMTTNVAETILQKTKSKKVEDDVEKNVVIRDPIQNPQIALDPFLFNEMEFVNLSTDAKAICLKEESDGTIVKAFPGKAVFVKDLNKVVDGSVADNQYQLDVGDHVKVKMTDPMGSSITTLAEEGSEEETLHIDPVYYAHHGREVKVIHETGIVVYDTASSALPVGQLISCKPMSKDCDTMSIRILKSGKKAQISLGLVPKDYSANIHPGWESRSIGFHADDGGVFLESGSATRVTQKCREGDVMQFYCDFDKNKGFFRKNGAKMIELNLNPSRLAFYPCIGFHSLGEAVEIIEKDPWRARNEEERALEPPAMYTYKYGNLWISPGKKITLNKLGSQYCGWISLHNPKKDHIGFKVQCGPEEKDNYFGVIGHKKAWLQELSFTRASLPDDGIMVEWVSLETGREYTTDEMKILFGETAEKINITTHQHKLPLVIHDASTAVEELPTMTSQLKSSTLKKMMRLQVFKNFKLLDEYWLKYGSYQFSVETKNLQARFLLKYPKCPSFQYSKTFQKGMRLTAYLEGQKLYAECIVVDVYNGGKMLALEYSPKDKTANTTICVMAKSPALQFTEFDKDKSEMLPYESRNTPASILKTSVYAPPYLLSEGGKKVLNFINREWKWYVLRSMKNCDQVFTRLTVQERQICRAAKGPLDWMKNSSSNYLFTFLPEELSMSSLMYPKGTSMYTDLSVHRMCFSSDELMMQAGLDSSVAWRIPLHFVDIPGIKPQTKLPLEATFCDGLNVWTYVCLISNRLYLPSYKNILEGDFSQISRGHVEQLMYNLLQSYAALCGIYSAPWGGVELSQEYMEDTVKQAIQHEDKHLTRFNGKPNTETEMLYKRQGFATCKAHCVNIGVSDTQYPEEVVFDYDYFEPYTDVVSMFYWSQSKMAVLPDNFFTKFKNLQYFRIGQSDIMMLNFTSLPEGIEQVDSLKVIEITNTAMTKLPDDLFMSPSALTIACANMPVSKLPTKWNPKSPVTELILAGMLLKEIPDELSAMIELTHLELCYNPITTLPDSLSSLRKLNFLKLIGCPWFTLEGKRSQITHDQYLAWHNTHPFIKFNLGAKKIEELFEEYDQNHNKSLDEEELGALNLRLFFDIPRLGISDINDQVTGGIPAVIFTMKNLNELYLDYNSITMVPQAINNLQNLKVLSLNHNPLLESLPGSLGHLPNIKGIQITSCPMLRTPPIEVVSRGFESVKAYLKRLAGGFTECRRTKLMVVGLGGAGKTSLLRALMSDKKKTSGTEQEIPTDGIDIVPWTVTSSDGRDVTYSTWDFAGQAVYYNTHQFFLSKRAVYLLLWSMRQGYEHAGLDFWLSSICCHAPGTPILVIGTQCDLIPKAEIPIKELMERYPQIAGFHRVSSIDGTGIEDLQKSLIDVTLQQGYMGEKIPQVWLNFEKRIIAERLTKKSYIKWDVACQYAMEQGIYDEKDVRLSIQLLHDLGTVQYFDNDFLRDYVVINPQWIVNVMACVVSAQDSPIQKNKGHFLHSDIETVWADYDKDLHPWLLRLTEDFDLTFPLPKEPVNVVPCLLPGEEPEDLNWPNVKQKKGIRETKMVYRFTYLPSGLFNRAQVRLFQFSDGKKVWKKGSMLSKNKHLALIKQTDNKELVVLVQGPRPENIMFLIHEVFESIIEESFNGVSYDLYVPCPDCILKEGTTDPDLLNAKLIQRAKDLKAPFIQCYKYFHWISMAQLQEKLPADSREVADFDIQLQQSVVTLQELNNELLVDIAILYCSADLPPPGDKEKLSPITIRDDIQQWGYSCWFSDDMDKVSYVDLMATIKNCKLLITCISDNFEADTKCQDIFLYAKETMNKDCVIVVLGESLAWKDKDLGMKINQERLLMVKTRPRYEVEGGRRAELKVWLEEKIAQLVSDVMIPDVFVSYAWQNSINAAEKSGRVVPGAIGWADPRSLKASLEEDSVKCWLDIENVGKDKKGIFADMAGGIRNSKVMLACISDEYATSENCMMELRFGILNMDLPLVVAVVGTGTQWKETEVAMLLRRARAPEVFFQKENPEGVTTLIKYIKDAKIKQELSGKAKNSKDIAKNAKEMLKLDHSEKKEKNQTSTVALQEEYELIQRKFMRHICHISSINSMALPRLIVVDFVKSSHKHKTEGDGRESRDSNHKQQQKSKKTLRPKTATKSRDRLQIDPSVFDDDDDEEDWLSESFCLKVLCEHEEGWHLCCEMYPLAFRTRDHLETFMKKAAPYLYRINTILKQSPIKLKCFNNDKGEAFMKWIRNESEESLDFVGALTHLWSELAHDEATEFVSCLSRCRLPSGKIVWLCEKHQSGEHVAKLSTGSSGGSYNLQKVLFNEDKLLMENMEKSAEYKKLKGIKSTKVAPVLPKPVPIPNFMTPALPPPQHVEDKKPVDTKNEEKKEVLPPPPPPSQPPPPAPKHPKDKDTDNKEETKTRKDENEESTNTTLSPGESFNQQTSGRKSAHKDAFSSTTNDTKVLPKNETALNSDRSEAKSENVEGLSKDSIQNPTQLDEKDKQTKEEIEIKKSPRKQSLKEDITNSITKSEQQKQASKLNQMIQLTKTRSKPTSLEMQAQSLKKELERKPGFKNVARGSNVRRVTSNNPRESVNPKSSPVTGQSKLNDMTELASSLHIKTVRDTSSGSSTSSVASKKSDIKQKKEIHPLVKVRPKKIKVQPQNGSANSSNVTGSTATTGATRKMSLTATGQAVIPSKNANQMPLPERTGSKACVLQ